VGVGLSRSGRRAAVAATVILGLALLTRPAVAQITFGSPGDPPHFAMGLGAFDITPSNHKDAETAAEARAEYRFGDRFWIIAPFVGVSGTSDGAFYGYGGFGFDVNFGPNWVLTPTAAAGYFERGQGTKLGSWWEFRTGAEFAYRFPDKSRLGIAVNHTSNAGLTKRNPGEQSVVLVYSVPMPGIAW
jgi:lipid A 3-O-deacylase